MASQSVRRPNLLFIYTDEQRFDTLSCYGNTRIEMPNLNALADRSTVFDQAYVTQPVCTPSRASLLTGLWPHASGCAANDVPLPSDVQCLPEMLRSGGYRTAHFGKWHLGDEIFAQHGFDEWRGIEDAYYRSYSEGRDRDAKSSYHHFLIENGFVPSDGWAFNRKETARLPEEFGKPAYLAREASRFIEDSGDQPFVLYVNFLEPHMPFFGPRDDQYCPDQLPLPASFDQLPGPDQSLRSRILQKAFVEAGTHGLPLKTESDWRRLIANYWGLCSLVDTHVGTILGTLGRCGLWDDTMIVFTSDHGDMMSAHRMVGKCVMFEESVRVPLLVKLPGQQEGRRVMGPVSQIDVVPTLLDLLDETPPDHLQGKSLVPALVDGGSVRLEDSVFIQWNGDDAGIVGIERCCPSVLGELACTAEEMHEALADPVRTVINADGWKLNLGRSGETELYNLREDPCEISNLANSVGQAARIRDMAAEIREWQAHTGDTVVVSEEPADG